MIKQFAVSRTGWKKIYCWSITQDTLSQGWNSRPCFLPDQAMTTTPSSVAQFHAPCTTWIGKSAICASIWTYVFRARRTTAVAQSCDADLGLQQNGSGRITWSVVIVWSSIGLCFMQRCFVAWCTMNNEVIEMWPSVVPSFSASIIISLYIVEYERVVFHEEFAAKRKFWRNVCLSETSAIRKNAK